MTETYNRHAMASDSFHSAVPYHRGEFHRRPLSIYADMQPVRDRRREQIWVVPGGMEGDKANLALPPMGRPGLRPRLIIVCGQAPEIHRSRRFYGRIFD